jgi:hypothetical protein
MHLEKNKEQLFTYLVDQVDWQTLKDKQKFALRITLLQDMVNNYGLVPLS